MRALMLSCAVLGAAALPLAASPADGMVILPAQQAGRDDPAVPVPRASSDDRPILLPLPILTEGSAAPASDARPAAAPPVKRRFVIPWQTGVFQ